MRFKKYKRRFSKYRKQRYRRSKRGYRKYGFTSKVRRAMFKISESKYADINFGPFNLTDVDPAQLISAPFTAGALIPQGTAKNERVGDSIFVTKMSWKLSVLPIIPNPNFNFIGPFFLRFFIYTNRAGGNNQPLNYGPAGLVNLNSFTVIPRENVRMYKDKLYQTDAVANVLASDPKTALGFKYFRVRLNKKLTSQAGNWDNSFFMGAVYCNDVRDANLGFQINGTLRIYYKDI